MRLVYFGTASFAVPALAAMAKHVVMVVSQPDRPTGRGMKLTPSPVRQYALDHDLPTLAPERPRGEEFLDALRALEPDVLLVAAYGHILNEAVLTLAPRGAVNLHGSILPKYRGAAPIQRCLIDGEAETGVTLMQMDRGMDTGDLIAVAQTPIGPDETYGELQERLATLAAELASDWMPQIVKGDYPCVAQDNALATHAAKLTREDGRLEITNPARASYDRFRGVTPSPSAFIETDYGRLKITRARIGERSGIPGEYLGNDELAFAQGSLKLLEVQPEGRGRMSLDAVVNGWRLKPGQSLVSS